MNLQEQISRYLESKENSWSKAAYKTESSRLKKHARLLELGPKNAHEQLVSSGMAPYTIKTIFIRLIQFEKFIGKGQEFKQFNENNRNLFKHAYRREELKDDYESAKTKISSIQDQEIRALANAMLQSGIRISEIDALSGTTIQGKGGKVRPLLIDPIKIDTSNKVALQARLRRSLTEVGLKPHSLRKLFLTELGRKGVPIQDLAYIAGHTSIQTTMYYLQNKKTEQLKLEIKEALNAQ